MGAHLINGAGHSWLDEFVEQDRGRPQMAMLLTPCAVCREPVGSGYMRFADFDDSYEGARYPGGTPRGQATFCLFHGQQAQRLLDLTVGEALTRLRAAASECMVQGCGGIGTPCRISKDGVAGPPTPEDRYELRSICHRHARELKGPVIQNIFQILAKTHDSHDLEKLVAGLDDPQSGIRGNLRWPWRRAAVIRYLSAAPPIPPHT
jgi:hypothetical protein